ncbi:hypothetical protein CCUS01_02125 [Colletotrichum cuscutae]|uniref:C2H2-type domain-containing protein n=1 Tax=Colletotrichum cuscutae TaxID=1209917 RepID=A0AAI9U2W6_9PEZI|nr:hypothetical protein CCUS01_02125 [Colletotrichum cuscutae]
MDAEMYAQEAVRTPLHTAAALPLESNPPQQPHQLPFICTGDPNCTRSYEKKHELNRHMRKHSKPCACTVENCTARFADKKGLDRHKATHGIGRDEFDCPGCTETFTRADNLYRHRQKQHQFMG